MQLVSLGSWGLTCQKSLLYFLSKNTSFAIGGGGIFAPLRLNGLLGAGNPTETGLAARTGEGQGQAVRGGNFGQHMRCKKDGPGRFERYHCNQHVIKLPDWCTMMCLFLGFTKLQRYTVYCMFSRLIIVSVETFHVRFLDVWPADFWEVENIFQHLGATVICYTPNFI